MKIEIKNKNGIIFLTLIVFWLLQVEYIYGFSSINKQELKESKKLNQKAIKLFNSGNVSEATSFWEKASQLAVIPEIGFTANSEVLNNLGYAYYSLAKNENKEFYFEEAEFYFYLTKLTDPKRWNLYLNFGDLYTETGEYIETIDNYERLLEIKPDYKYGNEIKEKIKLLRQKELDIQSYTKEEIASDILLGSGKLKLIDEKIIQTWDKNQLLVTLYRNEDILESPDILIIWQKYNDKYKKIIKMRSKEITAVSFFEEVKSFKWGEDFFIHITMRYSGTGNFSKEIIYCVMPDNTLKKVFFRRADDWFVDKKIGENEYATGGQYHNFTDNNLPFHFFIKEANPESWDPIIGEVAGIYKIIGEKKYDPKTKKYDSNFIIIVDKYKRVAVEW